MAKSELIAALEHIEREKGIKKDDILRMIEGAVVSSLRKHVGKNAIIEASIDPETAEFHAQVVKKVADPVVEPELEMTLQEAKQYKKDAAIGDDIRYPAPAADFARIAAQTAKQLLTQKVREVERDKVYDEFKPKEGEVVSGSVHRFMERNVIVDLSKTEAILPLREQIRRERYSIGQNLRAVILHVDKAQRGPQVLLSRAASIFLRRLFELEIPEINEKIIEIVEIARDPGFRAKVSVKSNDPKVDAVGSCVGVRGARIRSLMNEVAGEKIDLILFSDKPEAYIANALAPAKISRVGILDEQNKRADAFTTEDQLPLAIGKEGQNLRLASRLTGWNIEIKVETAPPPRAASGKSEESKSSKSEAVGELAALKKIGPKTLEILAKNGFTIARLAEVKPEELTALDGIGEKTAANIIASAKECLKENQKES